MNAERRTSNLERLPWLTLSFAASLTLYAVNTYLATDIASFPLLWCVPLSVFLLAFAAGFSASAERHRRALAVVARFAALAALSHIVWFAGQLSVWINLAVPLAALAAITTALSAELANRRPHDEALPAYYTGIGLGGVIAGVVSVVLLPWIWSPTLFERVPILAALVRLLRADSSILLTHPVPEYAAALALTLWLLSADAPQRAWRLLFGASMAMAIAAAGVRLLTSAAGLTTAQQWGIVAAAVTAAAVAAAPGSRLAAASLAIALVGGIARPAAYDSLFEARNFFGTLRVQLDSVSQQHRLKHGTTLHGTQPLGRRADQPTTYYGAASPIGQVMHALHPRRVLVVGLGVGTMAAYGGAGDRYTFLEINPLVARVAGDRTWFSYLDAARRRGVTVDVSIGDGRILARGLGDRAWDVIVVDAFSSDSVPVHLLTVEALQEFSRTLADRGVIAFHVSNRFFDLQPAIAAAAERAGMTWAQQRHVALDLYDLTSTWVMAARSSGAAAAAGMTGVAWTHPPAAAQPWTDDWANVLGARKPWTNDNGSQ